MFGIRPTGLRMPTCMHAQRLGARGTRIITCMHHITIITMLAPHMHERMCRARPEQQQVPPASIYKC